MRLPDGARWREGAAARTRSDDDDVVGIHRQYSSIISGTMIRAAASISARWENAWWKFPRCRPVAAVELLGVEPEGRGDRQALHQVAGPLQVADDRQAGDEPEGADQEGALLA